MSEWRTVTISEIAAKIKNALATGPFGSAIGSRYFRDAGVPIIRGSNLSLDVGQRLNEDDLAFLDESKALEFQRSVAKRGDLVFTCWGTIGQVGLIDGNSTYDTYIVSNKQMKLSPDPVVADSEFLYYSLSSPAVASQIQGMSIGSSVPGLNLGQLRQVSLTLPPLAEQHAIAAVLSALDDKIAVNERIVGVALELASAHYAIFSIRKDWQAIPLMDAATWLSGGTPATNEPSYWNGDLPWISASSLKTPWIADSDRRVTDLGATNGTRTVPKGTVIFVVRGMSLKVEFRIGVTQREVSFGQDCKALIPKAGVHGDVLFHAIRNRTSDILELVDEAGHGTGRLPTDRIGRVIVRLPAGESDEVITVLAKLNAAAARAHQEIKALEQLRDTLLPGLMSGEIRVRDAEKVVEDVT